jgi:hypothetical protein
MTKHVKGQDLQQAKFLYYFGHTDRSYMLHPDYADQVQELASQVLKYTDDRDLWPILADMITFSSVYQAPGMHLLDLLARLIIIAERIPIDYSDGWEAIPPLDTSKWRDARAMMARYYIQKFVDGKLRTSDLCVLMLRHIDTIPFLDVFHDIWRLDDWLEQDTRIRKIVPDMLEKLEKLIRDLR